MTHAEAGANYVTVEEAIAPAEATAMTIADDAEFGGLPYELQDIRHGRLCGEYASTEECEAAAAADARERYEITGGEDDALIWEKGRMGQIFGRLPGGAVAYRITPQYDEEDDE